MNNKVFFWLTVIFVILNIVDTITTIFIIGGESNPLYHLFGSIYVVYALKLIVVLFVIWLYKLNVYPSKFYYFFTLTVLMYGCLSLLIAQCINIYGMLHPVLLQQASQVPTAIRVKQYFQISSVLYLIPATLSLVIFKLYDKSIDNVIIDKQYNKYKGWWRIW